MIESFNKFEQVSIEEINNYGDSKYVSSYYYVYNLGMNSSNLDEATDSLVKETTTTKTEVIKNMRAANRTFTLMGYSSYESMTEFIEGSYTITEGSVSNDFSTNTCVIIEELTSIIVTH